LPTLPTFVRLALMTNTIKSYENAVTKKLDKSRIEITASIPAIVWEENRKQALKNINDLVTIDGFRKGMVPENVLISKVGEHSINEEMAELALSKAYLDILIDNKIDAIGKPEVQITKMASGNPLEFKIVSVVIPEVKLPDYKAIAKKEVAKESKKEIEVEEKDIEEAILKLRKSRVPHEGHDHEKMTPEEFVHSLGEFKDIADFKEKIREMIKQNKKYEAREKTRILIADAISNETQIELPEIMINSELDRTQAQFATDVEKMGVKLEDYLKHAKKTIEEVRKEWTPHAEKKAKFQLILNAIATTENIRPDQKEIENEVNQIVEQYKDADHERAAVYAETVLTNEKVFAMLENTDVTHLRDL